MKKIFVAIPAYTGEVCIQTLHSLLASFTEAREAGWEIKSDNVHSRVGDADIGLARNAFLGWFLDTDCTDLVFIDADISWQKDAFLNLLSHVQDFVCGAYRAKRDDKEIYPILWPEQKNLIVDEVSQKPLLEIAGCGFGFVKLSRAGVENIAKAAPRHFYDPLFPDIRCPWLFEFAHEGEQRFSEDYVFCRRWRENGGKIWLDPSITLDHTGKKTYNGDIYSVIKRETFDAMSEMAA